MQYSILLQFFLQQSFSWYKQWNIMDLVFPWYWVHQLFRTRNSYWISWSHMNWYRAPTMFSDTVVKFSSSIRICINHRTNAHGKPKSSIYDKKLLQDSAEALDWSWKLQSKYKPLNVINFVARHNKFELDFISKIQKMKDVSCWKIGYLFWVKSNLSDAWQYTLETI